MLRRSPSILFFILMLFGQSLIILGWVKQINEVLFFGIGFAIFSTIALQRQMGIVLILSALLGTAVGMLIGGLLGRLLGPASSDAMGIIGSGLLGGFSGLVFWSLFVGPLEALIHAWLEDYLPRPLRILSNLPIVIAIILGAVLGVLGLKDTLPTYFGNEGSGAFVGGVIGLSSMLFFAIPLAHQINKNLAQYDQ